MPCRRNHYSLGAHLVQEHGAAVAPLQSFQLLPTDVVSQGPEPVTNLLKAVAEDTVSFTKVKVRALRRRSLLQFHSLLR